MKRELLKELGLEEDTIETVMKEHGKALTSAIKRAGEEGYAKAQTELADLRGQLEELERVKEESMTLEERLAASEKKAEKAIKAAQEQQVSYQRMMGEAQATAILAKAGMDDDSIAKVLESIVVDEVEATVRRASSLSEIFSAQAALAAQKKEEELLSQTKRPPAGDSDGELSTGAQMAAQYNQQFTGGTE